MNLYQNLILTVVILFGVCFSGNTQEVDVFYNLTNDQVTYSIDGKQISKPKVKKGQSIQLHVTEYNPYLYDLDVEVKQTNVGVSGSGGLSGLAGVPGFGSFLSSFGAFDLGGNGLDVGGGLPLLEMPLLKINDNEITLQSLFGKSRGSAEIMQSANKTMLEINNSIEKIQMSYQQVKRMNSSAFYSKIAIEKLDDIKLHPNLKPSIIKSICSQYYHKIYPNAEPEDVSIDELEYWRDFNNNYRLLVVKMSKEQSALSRQLNLLQLYSDQLSSQSFEEPEYREYIEDLLSFRKESQAFNEQTEETISSLPDKLDHPTVREMTDLQIELAEVVSNDFTYHTRIQPTKDEIEVKMKLIPKGAESDRDDDVILERSYTMEAKGGLKVNASLGVAFSRFFDQPYKYDTKNGVIVADKTGQFNPSVASFIHFYSYGGRKTNVGGTFGIGFPIFSGSDDFSIEFYLGPSLILGSSQRLVVTAGIMGGSVDRLGKGYSVGDPFDSDLGDIPLTSSFELGAFAGISFNLVGGR